MDQFEAQAMTLLTNPQTRHAFDLTQEDARTRDRYGRNRWGQQLLLARRLVESGVEIITSCLDGPQCGRVANWDDHAVNHHVFDALRFRAGAFDQAVSALIEDVYARGLDKRVLVVVSGEFGRTPKISYDRSTGGGRRQRAGGHGAARAATTGRAPSPTSGPAAASRPAASSAPATSAARTSSSAPAAPAISSRRSITTSASTPRRSRSTTSTAAPRRWSAMAARSRN